MPKKTTLRWRAHSELSAAHAAFVVATGAPCTDSKTEQKLIAPVTEINNRLLSASLDIGVFWEQYLVEIARGVEIGQACTVALLWSGCHEMQIEQMSKAIASKLSDARLGFLQRFPKLTEQLDLRTRPLKERWDTFGPGLLRQVGKLVWGEPPNDWWPNSITVQMLQPIRGGDGGYDSEHDQCWMEAVLTDVDPGIPEVVRLGWLITRIAIDSYTRERSGDQSLSKPWSLVSVPLILTAAHELELIREPKVPIEQAMELWQFGDAHSAETVRCWWQEYLETNQPLPAALRVLDQRLSATDSRPAED